MVDPKSEGFATVTRALTHAAHPHAPVWLERSARTCAEAAEALGVHTGQIAKSVIFKRVQDERAVLVVAAGDRRVDEHKVAALVGPIARADAAFVKARTGFSIGGVSPVGHAQPPVALLDQSLWRFAVIWAAAGHPNGVFQASPDQLVQLTGAAAHDVSPHAPAPVASATPSQAHATPVASPCNSVCRMSATSGLCEGCFRSLDEIAAWSTMDEAAKRQVLVALEARRGLGRGAGP